MSRPTPKINIRRFEHALKFIDAHTCGEFCRIIYDGFDEPEGNTMMEKKNWMIKNRDYIRTALMLEPRGHNDMFGAYIVKPTLPGIDFGIIFIETGGYLNMCGHCTIGAVTIILEAGFKEAHEGENEVIIESPSGVIKTKAMFHNGKVTSVTFSNVTSFVYKTNLQTKLEDYIIPYTISFGGSFFALIDTRKIPGFPQINKKTSKFYLELGMKLLNLLNEENKGKIKHPTLDITTIDLIEFYGDTPNKDKADMRNAVVFGNYSIDRSPCGTGTSAKIATLYQEGKLKLGEPFRYESFIGSIFTGVAKEESQVGEFKGIIPSITGYSHLTGYGTYLIDKEDPLKYGFSING